MKITKRITALLAGAIAITGLTTGTALAATVPPGTPRTAVIEESHTTQNWYKLQNADEFWVGFATKTGLAGSEINYIHWTSVSPTEAKGTGKLSYALGYSYRNGPVVIAIYGKNYHYTRISMTLTESWYSNTNYAVVPPPYGHGTHFTNKPIYIYSNVPSTDMIHVTR